MQFNNYDKKHENLTTHDVTKVMFLKCKVSYLTIANSLFYLLLIPDNLSWCMFDLYHLGTIS